MIQICRLRVAFLAGLLGISTAHRVEAQQPPLQLTDRVSTFDDVQLVKQLGLNVKYFGAIGDGISDDRLAINMAYAALPASGGILYFPPGVYVVTSQLDWSDAKNVILAGAGTGSSFIRTNAPTALGRAPFWGMVKLSATGAGFKTLRDLTIGRAAYPSAAIANDNGIVLGPVQNVVNIERVTVENMGNDGILHRGNSASVNIRGCSIRENHFGYGLNGSGAAGAIQDLLVAGCSIYGNNGGVLIANAAAVTLRNNDIEGPGDGSVAIAAGVPNHPMINITASNVWLSGNSAGLPSMCNATQVAVLNGQNIASLGGLFASGAGGRVAITVGAEGRNTLIISPQVSAGAMVGGTAFNILPGAQDTMIVTPNYGNAFSTNVADAGTRTTVWDTSSGSVTVGGPRIGLNGSEFAYLPNQATLGGSLAIGGGGGSLSHTSGLDGTYNTLIGFRAGNMTTTGYYNTVVGTDAMLANTTGHDNVAVGAASLGTNTSGFYNTALGGDALRSTTSGSGNTAVGVSTLYTNSTGTYNVAMGQSALHALTTGARNTGIGVGAFQDGVTTGSGNVALGFSAGFYETGSNKLFIDNQPRANEADARTKALIYGIFDAAVANQSVAMNAQVSAVSIRGTAVTFGGLPSTPVEGMCVPVTDSTTATWGATITGGGANHVLAYYNGSAWTVAGK